MAFSAGDYRFLLSGFCHRFNPSHVESCCTDLGPPASSPQSFRSHAGCVNVAELKESP